MQEEGTSPTSRVPARRGSRPPGAAARGVLVVAAILVGACSVAPDPETAPVAVKGDLAASFGRAKEAGAACDLAVVRVAQDAAGGEAVVQFLSDWRDPVPESALLTVRLVGSADGVTASFDSRPLAEYGMRPPSAEAGASECLPCESAREKLGLVRYSPSRATANGLRAVRCLRAAYVEGAAR